MIKNDSRLKDIIKIIDDLDISHEMFRYAQSKYTEVSKFLESKGVDAVFYPQGSFALGTTVRPYKEGKDANFDLDAICETSSNKKNTAPSLLKEEIESFLKCGNLSNTSFIPDDRCCTLEYNDVEGCEFSLDVVSSVHEDVETKSNLKSRSLHPELVDSAIAIPRKTDLSYRWLTSNPKGYKKWFDNINNNFLRANPIRTRETIANKYLNKFSIEEIDPRLERSALQIAIKILKRHRDIYFSNKIDGNTKKPISAIITTLATEIAKFAPTSISVTDLLKYILDRLKIYSLRQNLSELEFSKKYSNLKNIVKENGKWRIPNPANPDDNLADSWNDQSLLDKNISLSNEFFLWIDAVIRDFSDIEELENDKYIARLSNVFGEALVKSSIDIPRVAPTYVSPKETQPTQKTKPYGDN